MSALSRQPLCSPASRRRSRAAGSARASTKAGGAATLRVTRDFGHRELGSVRLDKVHEGDTVMRMLRSKFDVTTRFGGRFVQSIDGLAGEGRRRPGRLVLLRERRRGGKGAAEWHVSPGDRIQWDRRDWSAAMRVPAIVGAYPAPFLTGAGGKRRPVRVECEDVKARRVQGRA